MELIGKLKEKVDQAESKEEKKKLIEAAGIALTDDELDKVAGGAVDYSGMPPAELSEAWEQLGMEKKGDSGMPRPDLYEAWEHHAPTTNRLI